MVAISLPGYGFSEAPHKQGFAVKQYAEVILLSTPRASMMVTGVLGSSQIDARSRVQRVWYVAIIIIIITIFAHFLQLHREETGVSW